MTEDAASPCGACRNMDAYWEERALRDPSVRDRLLRLQKQSAEVPSDHGRDEKPTETPKDEPTGEESSR